MSELGSWLIRPREARGLTLEDAERDTRISRRYLQALEAEQFDVIPAPVYARGFLRSYSQYLRLDPPPPPQPSLYHEPTIGIDIGVPVPARRLQTNPASQARSVTVAIVAVVGILAVVLLAFFISRLAGDDNEAPGGGPAPPGPLTPAAESPEATSTPAAGSSGLAVTPGVVPDV